MTNGSRDAWRDERPAPAWLGDVAAGVEAWTQGAAPSTGEPDRERSSGKRSRSGGSSSARGGRRASPPPDDPARLGPEADPESVARTILLDQLTGRARSRRELADKLASREVPDDVAARLLDRFEEVGLVDDAAFTRLWVSARGAGTSRGLARRALASELRRKGVADEVVRDALEEVEDDDEHATATALVERRLRSLQRVDDATAARRLVGMLARKGYPAGLCHRVVREVLAEARRDVPDDL
ncbi:recombination regulator RecX [Nocardioides sp. TRM66260-LWL]|uniref:regulatory protein RecX n=1 Tax=Nocardioides sp. TRM66260-LWL TaxID=2874478 RepID=UPI001CC64B24|nr:regulatory protein RecX [Nocardioides sp. TRM66260-LWL]MBZ5733779.1 recombination regulator RecX [Nocardioides sp. TRM66260-LWL]